MRQLFFSFIVMISILSSCVQTKPILKIGLVADPQYADKPVAGNRHYRESLGKLKEAIVTFNDNKVDFVQNLGDIIDLDWKSYDSILPLYKNLDSGVENYHLLGNHDFAVDSSQMSNLLKKLSMPDYYYSYVKKGWRFIVLDATDFSYYSNSLHHHNLNRVDSYFDNTTGKTNHYRWNSAIGEQQQIWLKHELDSAALFNQKVIVFSHLPVRPLNTAENLWNDSEIIEIIENSSNVVAFINGHNHSGAYDYQNGVHYMTISGMVNTHFNAYGILEIFNKHLVLKGYGNQKTFKLKLY